MTPTPVVEDSTVTQYIYDAEGNRVSKGTAHTVLANGVYVLSCDTTQNGFSLTNGYILGPSGEQLSEILFSGGGYSWSHSNIWAGGQLIATDSPNGSGHVLNFEFEDWLGSRRVLTDSSGNIQQTCPSLPFGNGFDCPTTPTEQLFTGKERDTESGNDYFGARYYASSMGRFISPDFKDDDDDDSEPVPYADLGNPQSLNLYAYVGNNPLTHKDADGHFYDALIDPNCGCWPGQPNYAEIEFQLEEFFAAERRGLPLLWNQYFGKKTPAVPPVVPAAQSTPADPNQNKPKFEPNKNKHHQNARGKASAEPTNSEELYNKAIKSNDKPGTWWAQDSDGVLHRFSSDNAGGAHWSGSTAGENGIESQNIPGDIKKAFGWTK